MIGRVHVQGDSVRIASQAVTQFPTVFRHAKRSVNREKANNWWTNRVSYLAGMQENAGHCYVLSTSRRSGPARSRIARKATGGRGRKREAWKLTIHQLMMEEFDRLCAARVKVTRNVIRGIAIDFVLAGNIADLPNLPVLDFVTKYFIQDICMRHNLVQRMQSGHRSRNAAWEEYYDRTVAHH